MMCHNSSDVLAGVHGVHCQSRPPAAVRVVRCHVRSSHLPSELSWPSPFLSPCQTLWSAVPAIVVRRYPPILESRPPFPQGPTKLFLRVRIVRCLRHNFFRPAVRARQGRPPSPPPSLPGSSAVPARVIRQAFFVVRQVPSRALARQGRPPSPRQGLAASPRQSRPPSHLRTGSKPLQTE